jgi:hypothetical protein
MAGNEGSYAWWRTALDWNDSTDDGAVIYGITVSSLVGPEAGQEMHALSSDAVFLLPPDQSVSVKVCAIDRAGQTACTTETVVVPALPGETSKGAATPPRLLDESGDSAGDGSGCSCTMAPQSPPGPVPIALGILVIAVGLPGTTRLARHWTKLGIAPRGRRRPVGGTRLFHRVDR